MSEFDWDDVRLFLAIAEAGSLNRAARAAKLSTATLSRRLESIETALGQRLFDRLPNRLQLTPSGQRLLAGAAVMREGADALARSARAAGNLTVQRLRITATVSISMLLSRHIAALQVAVPGATIEIDASRAQRSLAKREADIALRMRVPPERGDLVVRKVGRVVYAPYATEAYLAARGFVPGGPLDGLDVIASTRDPDFSRQEAWLAATFGLDRIKLRLPETPLRNEAALAGHGVTLLPCFLGDPDARLVRAAPPVRALEEDVYLLMHTDLADDQAVRALADAIVAFFKSQRRALLGLG